MSTKEQGIRRRWTSEEDDQLRLIYPDNVSSEVAKQLGRTLSSVYDRAKKLSIKKSEEHMRKVMNMTNENLIEYGEEGRFKKGQVPWNKGKSFNCPQSKRTQFKEGHQPHNTKSDGDITIRKDSSGNSYKFIRISKGKWIHLHRHIWSQEHGSIPKGFVIRFIDGDSMNCCIDNLEMVSRAEHRKVATDSPKFIASLIAKKHRGVDVFLRQEILDNHPELIEIKRTQLNLQNQL